MNQKKTRPMLEKLRRSKRELERRLSEKTAELEKTTQALQAEMAGRRRSEGELQLVLTITQEIGAAEGFLSAVDAALRNICQFTSWDFGEAWLPNHDGTALEYGHAWHGGGSRFLERFKEASQNFSPGADVGLPGRVWSSRQPEWVPDISKETKDRFPHADIAKDCGFKAVLGVPVIANDETVAMLAFFMFESRQEDKRLVEIVSGVAAQLGWALKHKKAEQALRAGEALERRRAEEQIQRGADWIQSLIDTTQDAVVSIDRQGRIVLFNPAAERIFGYERAEVQGQKVNILMAEPYGSEHDEYISRYEHTGEAQVIGRIRTVQARRKRGEIFPIELSVTEIKTDKEVRYGAFIRDISEKVKLQERLVEEEKLAAIGATAAKLAHEISNPLSGMYMQVQAVEQRLEEQQLKRVETVPAIRLKMRSLRNEINRLHSLLDEFTSLSRREKYSFRPTDLARLVAQVIEMEMENLRARGIGIRQELASDLPRIHADRDRLKQALLNLCKNAMEAMPQGGQLTFRGARSEKQVIFEIIDTGVGIPPGIDIFEPFVTTKSKGTGLGLMTARQIILAHQGTIIYTSEAGKGTAFKLTLPLSPSPLN